MPQLDRVAGWIAQLGSVLYKECNFWPSLDSGENCLDQLKSTHLSQQAELAHTWYPTLFAFHWQQSGQGRACMYSLQRRIVLELDELCSPLHGKLLVVACVLQGCQAAAFLGAAACCLCRGPKVLELVLFALCSSLAWQRPATLRKRCALSPKSTKMGCKAAPSSAAASEVLLEGRGQPERAQAALGLCPSRI